jgi:hypothetical protein
MTDSPSIYIMKDGSGHGNTLIKPDSLEAAAAFAKGCPVLKSGASITVYETFAADGM